MTFLLMSATALLCVLTLVPLSRNPVWWIRVWEFPRLQLAVMISVVLVLVLVNATRAGPAGFAAPEGWLAGSSLAMALTWQLWCIAPYSRLVRPEAKGCTTPKPTHQIRLLSSNVLMTNRASDKLLALVERHEPDILITLETDAWWEARLDEGLGDRYAHACRCPLDNLYGMHVWSRLPLADVEIAFLVEDDKPSMHMQVTLRSGRKLRLHVLHPAPPSPTENESAGERDAELVMVGKSVAKAQDPVIIAGDMNDVAWSHTTRLLRRVSGLVDPRIGRGSFNTFHAGLPFLRYPLDHFFHSPSFSVVGIERLPSIDSDHFPMMITLQLDGAEAAGGAPREEADADDEREARETMRAEGVSPERVPEPGETPANRR